MILRVLTGHAFRPPHNTVQTRMEGEWSVTKRALTCTTRVGRLVEGTLCYVAKGEYAGKNLLKASEAR
jgi:hypothetical protein